MRRYWPRAWWFAFLWMSLTTLAHGHAVVQRTSLGDAPVKANTPTRITLKFNSGIEKGFTRVMLVTESGEARPLEVSPGDAPATVSVDLPALAAGRYGLRYKVLAVDGHVTENVVRFTVAAPE